MNLLKTALVLLGAAFAALWILATFADVVISEATR